MTEIAASVPVAIIGVDGNKAIPDGTIAQTPGAAPNATFSVISPIVAILVRAANLFIVSLLAALGTNAITPMSFKTAAMIALSTTGLGALKDCATIFGKLEGKFPLASGSI